MVFGLVPQIYNYNVLKDALFMQYTFHICSIGCPKSTVDSFWNNSRSSR